MTEDDTFNKLKKIDLESADRIWDNLKEEFYKDPRTPADQMCSNDPLFVEKFRSLTGWEVSEFLRAWIRTLNSDRR